MANSVVDITPIIDKIVNDIVSVIYKIKEEGFKEIETSGILDLVQCQNKEIMEK